MRNVMDNPTSADRKTVSSVAGDAQFSTEWSIRACTVTRELVEQIARALQSLEVDLFGDVAAQRGYELSVFDAFGSETFRSVTDMPMRGFPESTEMVRMVLEAKGAGDNEVGAGRSLKIKVVFRADHGNRMSLRLCGPLAREKTLGFCERVDQLVAPYEIDSWFFRRRDWAVGASGLVALLGGLVVVGNIYDQVTASHPKMAAGEYWIWTATVGAASAYWAIVHWFHPLCAFDTRRWKTRQEWRRWAIQGFVGLIAFGTVLTAIGKRLLAAIGIGLN
jgi:hypothetical protein